MQVEKKTAPPSQILTEEDKLSGSNSNNSSDLSSQSDVSSDSGDYADLPVIAEV